MGAKNAYVILDVAAINVMVSISHMVKIIVFGNFLAAYDKASVNSYNMGINENGIVHAERKGKA